jgi:hypothetical protein
MAVLFFDGFDDYTTKNSSTAGMQTGGWTLAGNTNGSTPLSGTNRNPDASTVANRHLNYSNPTSSFIQDAVDLGTNYTALGGGMCFYTNQLLTDWANATLKGERIIAWYDQSNVYQCELVVDWFGRLHFCRGSTILASSPLDEYALIRSDVWAGLEWEIEFSQTVGEFRLWKDNVQIINATGLDNCDTANANCRYVRSSVSNGLDSDMYIDDWYITDGLRLGGNPLCISLHPTTDGGVNVWTAFSGTDEFAMVDENASDADTTYNQASTAGDESRHGCEDLPSYITDVIAVGAYALLRKTDAVAREARVLLNSGGTESLGNTLTLTTSYASSRIGVLETDPNTAAAWTLTNVNAVEVGYEVVS